MQHEPVTTAVATAGIHYVGTNVTDALEMLPGQSLVPSVPQSHALLLSNIPRYQPQPRGSLSPHAVWSLPQSIHDARRASDGPHREVVSSCGGNTSLIEAPQTAAASTSNRHTNNPTFPSLAAERPKINDPKAIQKAAFRFQQHQLHKVVDQQPNNQSSTFVPNDVGRSQHEPYRGSAMNPNPAPLPSRKRNFEAAVSTELSSQGFQRNVRHRFFSGISSRDQSEQADFAIENPRFSGVRAEEGSASHQNSIVLQQPHEQHIDQVVRATERPRNDELNELLRNQNQEGKTTSAQRLSSENLAVHQRNELPHREFSQKVDQKSDAVYRRPQDRHYQPNHIQTNGRNQYSSLIHPERFQDQYFQQQGQVSKERSPNIYLENQDRHIRSINVPSNQRPSIQLQGDIMSQERLGHSMQIPSSQQQHERRGVNFATGFNQTEQHFKRESNAGNGTNSMLHHPTMHPHPNLLQNPQTPYNMDRFDELKPIGQNALFAATVLQSNSRSNQPRVFQGTNSEEDGKTSEGTRTVLDMRGTHSDSRDVDERSVDVEDVPDFLHIPETRETKPYTCVQCAARFTDREQRKLHIQTAHAKPYMCQVCKSSFTRKFDLEKHSLTVHERVRPYACDQCHNSFGQKHHLVRHKKAIHIKARDFACDVCDSRFARKEHLANHKRAVHDKHKPFLCSLCDVQYCEKRALRRHLEHVHSVKSSRSAALAAWQPSSKSPPPSIGEILQL